MKRHWIEYRERWQPQPMTFWVYRALDAGVWSQATRYDPEPPRPVPGKGYAVFHLELDGFTFVFSSLLELDVCMETLAKNPLPSPLRLSRASGTGHGPNSHWLSRLPGFTKTKKYRDRAVAVLKQAKRQFEKELG